MKFYYIEFGKRIFDIVFSLVFLVMLAPIMLILCVLIYIKLGSPVLFKQQRPGAHGKPFILYKFRTMRDLYDHEGDLLPDADRLTPFGNLIRGLSLDELPELINVLKGEMSIVGPRPLLMKYLELYTPEQMRRHELKPGITGWAQINGRNALSWDKRLILDVWYVDHVSFALDVKIILLTLAIVLRRSGIREEGHVTMSEFAGTK
jgi:sugar transferase EpsL